MIQFNRCITVAVILVWVVTVSSVAQTNLLNYENSLKFARYLTTTQQYNFAAEEYERLNFLWPADTTIVKELVRTYRFNRDCSQFPNAYQLLSTHNEIYSNPGYAREYLRFCLTCNMEHSQYFNISSMQKPADHAFYLLSYYWTNHNYDSVFSYNARNAELISTRNKALYDLTTSFGQQKYKKPLLALAMSAVLPGSGKAYSKRWGDATISFLFIASSAFASYRAFKQKGIKSFNGWLFGGVAISFYSSNLYGSHKASKAYNESLRIQYQKNAENIIYNSF